MSIASISIHSINSFLIASLLFVGIILFYFIGLKIFQYKKKRTPTFEPTGIGPFEGAMLGLISLLLAFTFNQSASNYNKRMDLLMQESNSISTVLLKADLYPDSSRNEFRKDLQEYIKRRVQYYELLGDEKKISKSIQEANIISKRIWRNAATISQKDQATVKSMQMLPAISQMIDLVSLREEARKTHVPDPILWLLLFLCIMGSFIVGYASKSKRADWIILFSYSIITVMTVYLIIDLDQPRYGTINTNSTHRNMIDLLDSFQEDTTNQ